MENLCRVCMAPGSHRLFRVDSSRNNNEARNNPLRHGENVSSFDKLLQKLRYVTMLQVNDMLHFTLEEMV